MKKRSFILIALAAVCVHSAIADLVWSEDSGWKVSGGVLETIYGGGEEDVNNAIEVMNKARRAQEKGKNWSALSLYDDVVDDYPQSVFAPEALFQRSVIFTKRNQFEKANQQLISIIKRYPDYKEFNKVVGQIYRIGEMMGSGERPYYWGLIPGFRNYEAGEAILEGVIEKAPYSEYSPLALTNIARIANKRNRPEEAIDALDRLINNYPESTFAENAYLKLAETYSNLVQGAEYDQGSTREAITYFEDFMILYPEATSINDAEAGLHHMRDTLSRSKLILGDFYYNYRNNSNAALVFYNEAITIDPQSPSALKATEMIEKIESGVLAPKTPVDWVFGRYQAPAERSFTPPGESNPSNNSEIEFN